MTSKSDRPCPILAVASGKGGVGKTLCAVNLALCSARDNLRTALIDADPLSNVLALLDYPPPKRNLSDAHPVSSTLKLAPNFEVIFPQTKKSKEQAARLVNGLMRSYRDWLDSRYDLAIIDMPAGAEEGSIFSYLPNADILLLVTNPEPTAHVSAGILLKSIQGLWRRKPVYLWHNKYIPRPEEEFNSDDLIGNYNKNVDESERIHGEKPISIAYVPHDPSLDLTKVNPPLLLNLHRTLSETLKALLDSSIPKIEGYSRSRLEVLLRYFLRRSSEKEDSSEFPERFEKFLENNAMGAAIPSGRIGKELRNWLLSNSNVPLRRQIQQAMETVDGHVADLEAEANVFSSKLQKVSTGSVEKEITLLLKKLAYLPAHTFSLQMAGMLLFHFALIRFFSNEVVQKIVSAFIPRRKEAGISIRDRRRQIARLLGKDAVYQERFFAMIKKLYPVMSLQLDYLVNAFELRKLLFRDASGAVVKSAYVRLFHAAIYEIVNSGLGIVAGFRFRPTSRAFNLGYQKLKNLLL